MSDLSAPITRIIPHPRPIRLGSAVYLASEFRLADLAALQGWIEAETLDPFEDAAPVLLDGLRDRNWKSLLYRVIDEAEAYPPRLDSAEAGALINSPDGMAWQLVFSLRREHPGFDHAAAVGLLDEVTAAQWSRFSRLAWGLTPMGLMRSMILEAAGVEVGNRGGPTDWTGLWISYADKAGPTMPPFESLTLFQLRSWLAEGDPSKRLMEGRKDFLAVAAKLGAFWGDLIPDADPAQPPPEGQS